MRTNILLIVLAALSGCASPRCGDERGFVRLFNGRNLDGWIGARNLFYVEDGDLVFKEGPENYGNLMYHRPFTNFVARFSFKLVPNGNNGFAIRAAERTVRGAAVVSGTDAKDDPAYNGMEIQILDNTGDRKQHLKAWQYHGSIYGVTAAQRGYLRPVGEWNDEEVVADGPNVTVTLNGHVILAMSVKDCTVFPDGKEHPGLTNPSGYLGFLGHTMPVRIRDIRIRELP